MRSTVTTPSPKGGSSYATNPVYRVGVSYDISNTAEER